MADEGNLKMINGYDEMLECDEDFNEDNFSKFLNSTRENLAKLTIANDEISTSVDNGDMEFMNFLGQLKSELLSKSEKCGSSPVMEYTSPDSSPVVKCTSPDSSLVVKCTSPDSSPDIKYASPRSKSVSPPLIIDSPSFEKTKKKSFSKSSLHKILEIEEDTPSNFSYSRVEIAKKLYKFFNEKIFENKLPLDMEIEWSVNLRNTAGQTIGSRRNNIFYTCKIKLATKVLTNFERLRDTLLHEMCHAAVMMISQSKEHHGPLWKFWAARCNMIFPDIEIPTRCHNYEIAYRFTYQCDTCKSKWGRHSRSAKLAKALCGRCKVKLTLKKS